MTGTLDIAPAPADVLAWRRDQLVARGCTTELAARLAHDRRYDLHALIELAEAGCPPQLAVRILAPIEGEDGE